MLVPVGAVAQERAPLNDVTPGAGTVMEAIDPVRAPDLSGYRVYWRLTDQPQWQWSEFTTASQHTLDNVVIDNYISGVAAVSESGFESPVVFPGPIGAFTPVEQPAGDGS